MTRVAVVGAATPQVVAAIVAVLRVRARDGTASLGPSPASAWRRAARHEALRAARP